MDGRAPRKRHELEAGLIERAAKDEAFRRALLADPTGTLERELGVRMPEGVALTVVEETPVSRYFVDARVLSIFEGADETLCLRVIARRQLSHRDAEVPGHPAISQTSSSAARTPVTRSWPPPVSRSASPLSSRPTDSTSTSPEAR